MLSDTKFCGFDIPKQSFVFLDLYSALMDPCVWHKPHEFTPERFLDHAGQFDDSKESFIPFGIGEFVVYCKLLVGSQYRLV